jgi:rhodanese-related sulfurtransferase
MNSNLPIEIDCQTVAAGLRENNGLLLLDCRELDEHALVSISGARLLPMSEIATRLAELEAHREDPIAVHCHHGGRSLKVAHWLRSQGFAKAQSMAGGIDEWARQIDPSLPRY